MYKHIVHTHGHGVYAPPYGAAEIETVVFHSHLRMRGAQPISHANNDPKTNLNSINLAAKRLRNCDLFTVKSTINSEVCMKLR